MSHIQNVIRGNETSVGKRLLVICSFSEAFRCVNVFHSGVKYLRRDSLAFTEFETLGSSLFLNLMVIFQCLMFTILI